MIFDVINKLVFFGIVYTMYRAYSTASGGVLEILGDLPKTLAYIALLFAAGLIAFVLLLRYIARSLSALSLC